MKYPMYVDFAIYPFCNLSCKFCYAEAKSDRNSSRNILNLQQIEQIFQQFDELGVMRVGFEGGEPFLRKDWFDIFKLADNHSFNYFVNTNATLISKEVASKLTDTDIDKVCVSLDGSNALIHDKSRGKSGTFELTVQGIKNLIDMNINVDGIITLTRYNQYDILNILNLMHNLGIADVAIMLLAVVGNANRNQKECYLNYNEQKRVILELTDMMKSNKIPVSLTIVPVGEGQLSWELYLPLKEEGREDDLKYWTSKERYSTINEESFGCTAGKDNFFINSFGDVYGCSMMCSMEELKAGNLIENNLKEIWDNSEMFQKFRKITLNTIEGGCKSCEIINICKGGCRACAYAMTKSILGSDMRCPYLVV